MIEFFSFVAGDSPSLNSLGYDSTYETGSVLFNVTLKGYTYGSGTITQILLAETTATHWTDGTIIFRQNNLSVNLSGTTILCSASADYITNKTVRLYATVLLSTGVQWLSGYIDTRINAGGNYTIQLQPI